MAVSFSIPASSVDFWVDYLEAEGLDIFDPFERFGKLVVGFQDPDGLHLELVGDPEIESTDGRGHQSIPDEHAIRGLHGVTLAEENYLATGQLLTESLGFEEVDQQHDRILFQADTALGSTIELIDGAELDGKPGKGTVHHIAFRAEDRHQQDEIRAHLKEIGYHLTENQDRHFFQSFFFHEPGGALVEVATDNPGFTIDEDKDELGTKLSLPPQLEQKRSLIEAELPTLILKP